MRFLRQALLILIALVLQTVVFARLNFFGVIPDLVLVSVVILTVLEDEPAFSLLLAFLAGLFQDALASGPYLQTGSLVLTVTLINLIKQSYTNDEYSFIAGLVALFTPLVILGQLALIHYFLGRPVLLAETMLNLVMGTLYNVILVPLVLPLLRRVFIR